MFCFTLKGFLNIFLRRRIFINNQKISKTGVKIADKDLKVNYSNILYSDGDISKILSKGEYQRIRSHEGPQKHVENYASGVFEGIRAFWHEDLQELRVLGLRQHVDRLFDSMTYCGLIEDKSRIRVNTDEFEKKYGIKFSEFDDTNIKYFNHSKDWVEKKILELIAQSVEQKVINPQNGCYIRPKVYRGMKTLANGQVSPFAEVFSLYHDVILEVFVHEWGKYVESPNVRVFENGIRSGDRRYKCISNYNRGNVAKNAARQDRFDEALLVDESTERYVLEGGGENIVIKDSKGILWTPFIDTQDILDGITLKIGLEIAKNLQINVEKYHKIPLNYLMDDCVGAMFYGTAAGNELINFVYDPISRKERKLDLQDKTLLRLKQEYDNLTSGKTLDKSNEHLREELFTSVPLEQRVLDPVFSTT